MASTECEEFLNPSPALSRAVGEVESAKTRTVVGAVMLVHARKFGQEVSRLTAAPPPDVLWCTLTAEGLVVHADMKLDVGAGGLAVPWAAMETLIRPDVADPVLRLTDQLDTAAKSAAHRLGMVRKRGDGASFGDRMQARFDNRGVAVATTVSPGAARPIPLLIEAMRKR